MDKAGFVSTQDTLITITSTSDSGKTF